MKNLFNRDMKFIPLILDFGQNFSINQVFDVQRKNRGMGVVLLLGR